MQNGAHVIHNKNRLSYISLRSGTVWLELCRPYTPCMVFDETEGYMQSYGQTALIQTGLSLVC